MATITLSKPHARLTPKTPPIRDSATLSVRNWAKSCQRVAPSAARTAISLWRAVPRASRRLATFTQAINRMKPTAPMSSQRFLMVSLLMKSFCKGSTVAPHPLFDFGYTSAMCRVTDSMSALACWRVTPGLRRPITRIK